MFRLLVAILSLISLSSSVYGQWTIVARNLLGTVAPVSAAGGVITYQANRVWAGDRTLWFSTDQGLNWQQSTLQIDSANQRISDVQFFDRNNGIVSTFGGSGWGKLFQTADGGATWRVIDSVFHTGFTSVAYGNSARDITTTESGTRITHDGGQSWQLGGPSQLFLTRQGPRLLTIEQAASHSPYYYLGQSFDDGATWRTDSALIPTDCYSLALDSCNPSFFVLANENYWTWETPISHILISIDAGYSWTTSFTGTRTSQRLTGGVARGKRAIYCTSMFDGVFQSVDYGMTWRSIGGPVCTPDSRSVCCLTDNLVLAFDAAGSIWRTTNGGGSFVHVPQPGDYKFQPARLFSTDTLSTCDSSVLRIAYLQSGPCDRSTNANERIIGPDASYFHLVQGVAQYPTGYDSVLLSFHADSARTYRAYYIVDHGSSSDTIQLVGYGRAPARSIAAESRRVTFDTINPCDNSEQTLWLRSSSCTTWQLNSITLNGPDSSHFSIDRSTPFSLSGRDSIPVVFIPDTTRDYHATVHIVLNDGTTLDLPLDGTGAAVPAAIAQNRTSLFDTVRLSECQSALQSVWIDDTACIRHSLVSSRIVGVDSSYYALSGRSTGALPDSIQVLFAPDTVRAYEATLELRFSDSSTIRIPLHGQGTKTIHTFATPGPLVFKDSVGPCDQPLHEWLVLHDTACRWTRIKSIELAGAKQLWLDGRSASDDGTIDSIYVLFYGGPSGEYDATITIEFDDTTIVVPIAAFGKDVTRTLSLSSSSLFVGDTVSPCAAPLLRKIVMTDSSCLPWKIVGYEWTGDDSIYYSIVQALPVRLTGSDTLGIQFSPDAPRQYSAELTVILDDGRRIPIALAGDGTPYVQVALSSTDLSTNIVGDDLHIPIYLSHAGAIPGIRFAVHYDTSLLVYKGMRTTSGQSLIDGSPNSGAFHVQLDSESLGSQGVVGYLDFQIFPTTDSCGYVVIDSLEFESLAARTCAVISMDSAVVKVCGPYDCTTPIFSNYLRHSALPKLSISPNPTTHEVRISSDMDLGSCSVILYSELGEALVTKTSVLSRTGPVAISLESYPEGRYYLTIQADSGYKKSFTVLKD